jgi:uncharacterized phiE125 gp8 family phage protein
MATLITAPAEEPITLAETRVHLRVEHDADDLLISGLITAARQAAESRTGRALVSQEWRATCECWPLELTLSPSPLISVEAVTYLDADGVRQTLAPSSYQVVTDTMQGYICPAYGATWPTTRIEPGSIRIDYTAGYGNASAVPQSIKVWMLMLIGTWYAQRESIVTGTIVAEVPRGFWEGLLDPYLIIGL